MSKKFNLALVGATGLVGREMLSVLKQRRFPIKELRLLASQRSAGETISFGQQRLQVENVADFSFEQSDIALFTAGREISARYVPLAKKSCVVIDNTSYFRYHDDVPLVIPEVNVEALQHYRQENIIANPNCSTIQMLVALKPVYDAVGIQRINVVTFQSVSGAGRRAVQELLDQSEQLINGLPISKPGVFPEQIAFNVIPQIDDFYENGYTYEEMKMVWETQKIFADSSIQVNPTAVRVPVLYGHSESVHIETREAISVAQAKKLLQKAPGVSVIDQLVRNGYPMPVMQNTCPDDVMVGRIRKDISHPLGLNLWIVSDNTRKGAALNAVQIAEHLVQNYL